MARKLIFLVTEDKYFYSHRLPMVRAAQREGFEVAVVTRVDAHRQAIEEAGVRVIPLSLERGSLNPFRALRHIRQIEAIYRRERPDIVHHIAMKPVLYGSLAAGWTRVPRVINAFAGLGYVFTARDARARFLRAILQPVFRHLLKRPGSFLLLQNSDDRNLLNARGMAPEGRTTVIPGSGIDLAYYTPQDFKNPAPDFIAVFAGRMIAIKGLQTLRDAFIILAQKAPPIKLWLCGAPDPANPGSWTDAQITAWTTAGANVVYKNHCPDMRAVWAQAHVAVQPSWGGEGIPKSLLEAGACARAIIATDVPGCRDMVRSGENGVLIPAHDAQALADALMQMASNPAQCRDWGTASRRLIEDKGLSADSITAQTAAFYRACLASIQ